MKTKKPIFINTTNLMNKNHNQLYALSELGMMEVSLKFRSDNVFRMIVFGCFGCKLIQCLGSSTFSINIAVDTKLLCIFLMLTSLFVFCRDRELIAMFCDNCTQLSCIYKAFMFSSLAMSFLFCQHSSTTSPII